LNCILIDLFLVRLRVNQRKRKSLGKGKVFQADGKWYKMETQIFRKRGVAPQIINMLVNIKYCFFLLISLKYRSI